MTNTTVKRGNRVLRSAIFILALSATSAGALALDLPSNARETAARDSALESVGLPTGPYEADRLPSDVIEGAVQRRAYRLPTQGLTPLQMLAPLRAQLQSAGYEIVLDCDQVSCGGFDFRFAIDVLPAPGMYVNIRDYHYLSARTPDGDAVMLLASAAESAAYLQVVTVGVAEPVVVTRPAPVTPELSRDIGGVLLAQGFFVLESLEFAVGTTTLSDAPSPELEALAAMLQARPSLEIALVGHTDTIGALETNISVSRARAEAVRAKLVGAFDVNPDQVRAEGMGYLAPRANNLTEQGREANRRVEVIIVRDE